MHSYVVMFCCWFKLFFCCYVQLTLYLIYFVALFYCYVQLTFLLLMRLNKPLSKHNLSYFYRNIFEP